MRRENKLYSYQDQLMEMELRKVGEITAQHYFGHCLISSICDITFWNFTFNEQIHLLDGLCNETSFQICLLHQELEAKKKALGKVKEKLTPKQIEARKAQLKIESEIRKDVAKVRIMWMKYSIASLIISIKTSGHKYKIIS